MWPLPTSLTSTPANFHLTRSPPATLFPVWAEFRSTSAPCLCLSELLSLWLWMALTFRPQLRPTFLEKLSRAMASAQAPLPFPMLRVIFSPNTSDTKYVRFFLPLIHPFSNSPDTNGVFYNSILILSRVNQILWAKGQVPQDYCLTLGASHKSQASYTSDGTGVNQGFCNPLLRFHNLPEWLTEVKKVFYLHLLHYYKEQPNEGDT